MSSSAVRLVIRSGLFRRGKTEIVYSLHDRINVRGGRVTGKDRFLAFKAYLVVSKKS